MQREYVSDDDEDNRGHSARRMKFHLLCSAGIKGLLDITETFRELITKIRSRSY